MEPFSSSLNETTVKMKAGNYMIPVTLWTEGTRLFFRFSYNPSLMAEIKQMEGSKYHGYDEKNPRKLWSVHNTMRNWFQVTYLQHPGKDDPLNPYFRFDQPLLQVFPKRKSYNHQIDMFQHILTRHTCIIAGEMGCGKTLVGIEAIEHLDAETIWVAPKTALYSVQLEFKKWNSKANVRFFTYEGLKKLVENWPSGKKPPQMVVFDEASRIKNYTSQRSQAAAHLALSIMKEWKEDAYVVLMSGSPAPKSPLDWWSLCETAVPGFIREGTVEKFKRRLAILELRESFIGGGSFNQLVGWRDDPAKCDICGLPKDAETHLIPDAVNVFEESSLCHEFKPSINEVELLYKRMQGLVIVKTKKTCLDLPDKVYREIHCPPTQSMLNAAGAIQAKATSTIQALTLLRELSDGFQYRDTVTGSETCPNCNGSKVEISYTGLDPEIAATGNFNKDDFIKVESACSYCNGTGIVNKFTRETKEVCSPKEEALRDILEENSDIGRLVVYGGFTGSIDKITKLINDNGWHYIRIDGRGWFSNIPGNPEQLLETFQGNQYDKIVFVAQPSSGGMGVTLTAANTIVYYSNDFNGESRIQSEDRIHRIGMDLNRGATIIDLLCLPSDYLVLNNLKDKKRLQDITLGELRIGIKNQEI